MGCGTIPALLMWKLRLKGVKGWALGEAYMTASGLRQDVVSTGPMLFSLPINVNTSHWYPLSSLPLLIAHPEQDPEARKFAFPSPLTTGCERLKSIAMTTWSIFPLCLQARSSPQGALPCAFREKRKPHLLRQVMPHSITRVCGLRHGLHHSVESSNLRHPNIIHPVNWMLLLTYKCVWMVAAQQL